MSKRRVLTQDQLKEDLIKRAQESGVSQHAIFDGQQTDTAELQRRVWQAERERRDAKLWWVALLSCIASVISALAAWMAILRTGG